MVTSILSGPVINRLKIGEMKVGKSVYDIEKKPAKEVSLYTLETKSGGKGVEYQAVYEMDAEHADAVLPPSEAHSGYAGMANFEDPTKDFSIEGGRYKPKE